MPVILRVSGQSGLTRKWQSLEGRLLHSVGSPLIEIHLSGEDEPAVAHSIDDIERLLADEPEADKAKYIAAFAQQKERWDDAARELGFDIVDADLETAHEKKQRFIDSIIGTTASSPPGVAAKLAVIIQAGECDPHDEEWPWPELRSALRDLTRLIAPEAAPFLA